MNTQKELPKKYNADKNDSDADPVSIEWVEKILRVAYASKAVGNSTTAVPTQMLISLLLELGARRAE